MPGDGAFMAINADYFHTAQRSGRCRVEKEYAFNPVLYDPIPNFAIERIWLPKDHERRVPPTMRSERLQFLELDSDLTNT
eukprot:2467416-Prymnesium_polylepis.1